MRFRLPIIGLLISVPSAVDGQIRTPIAEPIVSTTPGPAPTGVTLTPTGPTSITVTWNAMAGASRYLVERRKTSDPACCTAISGALPVPGWTDNGLTASTQYTFRVSVTYTDGSMGYGEASTSTFGNPVAGPIPTTYGGTATQNVVAITWTPVPGALEYSLLRNGVEISRGGACTPTCINSDTREYGSTSAYAIQTRFPAVYDIRRRGSGAVCGR